VSGPGLLRNYVHSRRRYPKAAVWTVFAVAHYADYRWLILIVASPAASLANKPIHSDLVGSVTHGGRGPSETWKASS
jgi:hypothetical protein